MMGGQPPSQGGHRDSLTPNENDARIYCDGVFDLMHSGHFNAIRQARRRGGRLVVGVCSDEEVRLAKKSKPIFSAEERSEIMRACRWVDHVAVGTPYDVSIDFLKNVVCCDFVAHGDDLAPGAGGKDCYAEVRSAGLLKVFKRTQGVSTSRLVRRILDGLDALDIMCHGLTKRDSMSSESELKTESPGMRSQTLSVWDGGPIESPVDTRRMLEFIGHDRSARCEARAAAVNTVGAATIKTVYVWGHFDVMNAGFVRFLTEAKQHGDHLIVGLLSDRLVSKLWGPSFPILAVSERAMSLYALACVDEVVVACPPRPDSILTKRLGINTIVVPRTGMRVADTNEEGQTLRSLYDPTFSLSDEVNVIEIQDDSVFEMRPLLQRVADQLRSVNYTELINTRLKAEEKHYTGEQGESHLEIKEF